MAHISSDSRANTAENLPWEKPTYQYDVRTTTIADNISGTGWTERGFESLEDLSFGIIQEPVSLDLVRMAADQMGFGWNEQLQLPDNFWISDDYLGFPDDTYSKTHALHENVRNLPASQLYVLDLPKLSIEPLNLELTNLSLPFMDSGDFNMSLHEPLDMPINTPISSVHDVPQLLEMIGPNVATPSLSPTLGLRQKTASLASLKSADAQRQQRFHCVVNGCTKHYKRKHELKRHQKIHSGIKPHRCNVSGCNRSGHNGFARRDHLGQHLRKVHGTNLF